MKEIIIIEPDAIARKAVAEVLYKEGYRVSSFSHPLEAQKSLEHHLPDLILSELTYMGIDGADFLAVIKRDRHFAELPVIILSGRAGEADIVQALKFYADDYIVKPCSYEILLARIEAVLRRSLLSSHAKEEILKIGPLKIFKNEYRILAGGKKIVLTKSEFDVLLLLAERAGRVLTREYIIRSIRQADEEVTQRAVDVILSSIRKKMGDYGSMIKTIRSVGYKLGTAAE